MLNTYENVLWMCTGNVNNKKEWWKLQFPCAEDHAMKTYGKGKLAARFLKLGTRC